MSDRAAAFSAPGGPTGVLLLHGFTGSPLSMRPLADAFQESGFAVELPLLSGHGTTPLDLASKGYRDWLGGAECAYGELAARCRRIVVAGLSMGGTIALDLALSHPELAGLVLVNPMAEPPAPSFFTLLNAMIDAGTPFLPTIGSDMKRKGVDTAGYRETPVAAMTSLLQAVTDLVPKLAQVRCPVLLFSSRVDHVVPVSSGDRIAASVAGPLERIYLEDSYHVATLDNDAAMIEAAAVEFAGKVGLLV